MNRVAIAIEKRKQDLLARITAGKSTEETIENTRKSLDMDFEEFCSFQELKSLAVTEQVLSLDEGMTVYSLLGGTPEHFNSQSIEVKATLTKLYSELLGRRISSMKGN